ncbi:hypothetical protein ZOSMA_171G00290 [Zostera marina]|uniref:Fe2OG dioxygenase domain-containing protein n=1 Tax=Zostera marina TaxID=29655 RepID=A0A0K9PSJ4_ZOSMR|nr:hypothetical protein ZOSMA_171G00290 [Zostera marina]
MAGQLLSTGSPHQFLPESYIRSVKDRPKLKEVADDDHIPIVDLGCSDTIELVNQIENACRVYGFFQVVNHGVDAQLVGKLKGVAKEFFRLPSEEKIKLYSDDPTKKTRLSTSFNVRKETVHNWRDYLRFHAYPLEENVPNWPSNPPTFKEIVSEYCKQVRKLGFQLVELISESLGLEKDEINKILGEPEQHMAVNFYPPCPAPDLTYGLPPHTDPNALTILLQDQQVTGLQVLNNDQWIKVDPYPDAFVVNIGDQLQALSNGRYQSVWHRAIVNESIARLSVASFLAPSNTTNISAPYKLVGENYLPIYRNFTYEEYYKKFWSRNLDQEHCLELFKN